MAMTETKQKARQVSAFADALLVERRNRARDPEGLHGDHELRGLRDLIERMSDIRIDPPESFKESLFAQLPRLAEHDEGRSGRWIGGSRPMLRRLAGLASGRMRYAHALPSAAVGIFLVALLLVSRTFVDTPIASANEILNRSDAALATLVHPGQLLYRRWKVTTQTTDADGGNPRHTVKMIHEWMDGANFNRVAGRWYSADGRLLIAYTSMSEGARIRPNAYFSPGVYGEPRGVLNIEPTMDEFREAVRLFPEPAQRALDVYLDRQSIYEPIIGEVRANRTMIETPRYGTSALPRMIVSLDRTTTPNGDALYAVRVVDPAWIDFNWRSGGPPLVRLARLETVRYIARDSYLSSKTEETLRLEDGRQRFTTRELVEMRAMSVADAPLDPFTLEIPAGTPVQRQSAYQQLSGVSTAFGRLPAFTKSLTSRTHH